MSQLRHHHLLGCLIGLVLMTGCGNSNAITADKHLGHDKSESREPRVRNATVPVEMVAQAAAYSFDNSIVGIALDPATSRVIVCTGWMEPPPTFRDVSNCLYVSDFEGRFAAKPFMRFLGHRVNAMSFVGNATGIVCGVSDRSLHYWHINGQHNWSIDQLDVRTIADASSSGMIYVGTQLGGAESGDGGSIHCITLDGTDTLVSTFEHDTPSLLAYNEEGRFLAVGSEWGNLRIINLSDRKISRVISDKQPVLSMGFAPDGKYLAVGRLNTMSIYAVADLQSVIVHEEIGQRFTSCQFISEPISRALDSQQYSIVTASAKEDGAGATCRVWTLDGKDLSVVSTRELSPFDNAMFVPAQKTLLLSRKKQLFSQSVERAAVSR